MIGQKQIKGVCLSLLLGGSKGFNYCLNTKNNGFLFFHVAGGLLDAESLLRRLLQKRTGVDSELIKVCVCVCVCVCACVCVYIHIYM